MGTLLQKTTQEENLHWAGNTKSSQCWLGSCSCAKRQALEPKWPHPLRGFFPLLTSKPRGQGVPQEPRSGLTAALHTRAPGQRCLVEGGGDDTGGLCRAGSTSDIIPAYYQAESVIRSHLTARETGKWRPACL